MLINLEPVNAHLSRCFHAFRQESDNGGEECRTELVGGTSHLLIVHIPCEVCRCDDAGEHVLLSLFQSLNGGLLLELVVGSTYNNVLAVPLSQTNDRQMLLADEADGAVCFAGEGGFDWNIPSAARKLSAVWMISPV